MHAGAKSDASSPPPPRNWIGRIPKVMWDPVTAGILIFAAGGIAWLAKEPWLFPSLGGTAYVISHKPGQSSSNLYHVVVGNYLGIALGYLAVLIVGAWGSPSLPMDVHPTAVRMWASVLGVSLTILAQMLFRAYDPAGGVTTLLITLGTFKENWHDATALLIGTGIVALIGEVFRYLRMWGTRGIAES